MCVNVSVCVREAEAQLFRKSWTFIDVTEISKSANQGSKVDSELASLNTVFLAPIIAQCRSYSADCEARVVVNILARFGCDVKLGRYKP